MNESNKFRDYILVQWKKGKSEQKQVLDYLKEIQEFKSFNDFKEVISTMIELEDFQNYYNDNILELIGKVYLEKIFENGIKQYITELLRDQIKLGEKYNFYYALYQKFKYEENYKFPITEEDLQDICFERLIKFVESQEKGLTRCSNLYYLCRDHVDKENKVVLQERAHAAMRRYIENNQWEYISSLIRPYSWPIYKYNWPGFTIEPFAEKTFDGWENFWNFLNNFRDKAEYKFNNKSFEKYYKFFERYRDRGYEPFVVEAEEWPTYGIDDLIQKNNWTVVE